MLVKDPKTYSRTLKRLAKHPQGPVLIALPKDIKSSVLLKDEQLLLVIRQHPITLFTTFLLCALASILPFWIANLHFWSMIPNSVIMLIVSFWYFLIASSLLIRFILWFFNVYFITDERIIDVNFSSILYSDISITKIDKIEDSSAKTLGFWGIIFNYGHVFIQTASTQNEFGFYKIPRPEIVNKIIGELILEEEKEKIEGRAN